MLININEVRADAVRGASGGATRTVCRSLLLAGVAMIAWQASPAAAQTGAASDSAQLQEVVVTAQKRAENLQDVPISIMAVDEQQIRNLGANSLVEIQRATPGLNTLTGGSNRFIAIRGIGDFSRNIGNDARVGIYIDGVYQGRSYASDPDLLGVERIEVLRGPQGTLFGRNTVAGAISITTKRPAYDFGGEAQVEVGNLDFRRFAARVEGPVIADKVAVSLGFSDTRRDGFIHNVFLNKDINGLNSTSARGAVRFDPNEDLEMILGVDYFGQKIASQGSLIRSGPGRRGPYDIAYNVLPFDKRQIWGVSQTMNYRLPNDLDLTSITAYRNSRYSAMQDEDLSPAPIAFSTLNEANEQFTQELRFSSPTTGKFDYVAGLYYIHQDISTYTGTFTGPPLVLPGNTQGVVRAPGEVTVDAGAAFLNVNYRFTDALELSLGVRVTKERKSIDWSLSDTTGVLTLTPLAFKGNRSDTDVSPRIALKYDVSDDIMIFANASKAQKSGGWNADFIRTIDQIGFDPEKVTNFEGGIKSMFFDRRVRANVTVFQADYDDFQVFSFVPAVLNGRATTISTITNAGKVRSRGVEGEFTFKPNQYLTISDAVTYNDAYFQSFKNGGGPGVDYDGNRPQFAPKWKNYLSVELAVPVRNTDRIVLFVDHSHTSKYYLNPNNTLVNTVPGYSLVSARLTYELGDSYEVSIWAKNLTDNYYYNSRGESFLRAPREDIQLGRTYGVRLNARF